MDYERKNLKCPVCGNITDINELKRQFNSKQPKKSLIAVIEDGNHSKNYRLPEASEIEIISKLPKNILKPIEKLRVGNHSNCIVWGGEFSFGVICFPKDNYF